METAAKQPQHIQEEKLSIQKNANDKICIWSEIDLQGIKSKNILAILYDIPHGAKAEDSAQRILKCLNNEYKIDMHEELIDKIKVFVHYANTANKSLENGSKAECFGMLEGIIKQGNELLKQAK